MDKIIDENIIARKPMTVPELRERVKHIAGLCWGLSIDLQNEIEAKRSIIQEFEQSEATNKQLKSELAKALNEIAKIKPLTAQIKKLEKENARLNKAIEKSEILKKQEQSKEKANQIAWERKEYGSTLNDDRHCKSNKPATIRKQEREAKILAMSPEERYAYEKKLETWRKHNARRKAAQAKK